VDSLIDTTVGSYRIMSVLGRGGMGVVYRAEHVRLGRPAALKMLQPHLTYDPAIVQRFFNEARAASAIDHPAIIEVFDYGMHDDDRAYLVMALLQGETLTTHIEQRAIQPREVAHLMAQVADGLAAAHDGGIIHRDLKPDNIMLVPSSLAAYGFGVKLLDFGIAKLADAGDAGSSFRTQTGYVIGTPLYMSPEQCTGASDLDHRADLYSLGCIAYHALAGRPPFESTAGAGAIIAAQLRDEPPDPRTFVSTIPDELVQIVMRLLAKDPAARYQSAREVRDAFAPSTPARSFVALPRSIAGQPTTATGAAAEVMTPATSMASSRRPTKYASRGRAVALVAIALGIGGAVMVVQGRGNDAHEPVHVAIAGPAAPPTVDVEPPPPSDIAVRIAKLRARTATTGPGAKPELRADRGARGISGKAPAPAAGSIRIDAAHDSRGAVTDADRSKPAPPAGSIRIDAGHYARSARIAVAFASFVRSTPDNRAWVVVAPAGKPSPGYEAWTMVTNGARRVTLFAPAKPGNYEVRFYRDVALQASLSFTVP
jgi:Protein kinase domain